MSIFNKVQDSKVNTNRFDLTHSVNLSAKMGKLTPIMALETIPGDSFQITGNSMIRLAPTIAPVMGRMDCYLHYFFVPNRIMWDNWPDFITGGEDGNDEAAHPYFQMELNSAANTGSLADYMGVPTDEVAPDGEIKVNALPFCAYQKIYDDYYRDENLEDRQRPQLEDGENIYNADFNTLRTRAYNKDYFTSALPWTQRGPEAMLPLGTSAPITIKDEGDQPAVIQKIREFEWPYPVVDEVGTSDVEWQNGSEQIITGGKESFVDISSSHEVDMSAATAASINELRRAIQLQVWLERNATGGARYIESIESHFGVKSSDKRLQRPEYIGGFKTPIKMSEVLQTSQSDATGTPQGNMAGHGISIGGSKRYKYFCEEHGWIIGIMSILPKVSYYQGLHRSLQRFDKFDYAWPEFAHIGEQPIYYSELYVTEDEAQNNQTFGYTPRYAEYKTMQNRIAGDMRTTLDFWHLGRLFQGIPSLNEQFIKCNHQTFDKIFAVQDGTDPFWCQVLNEVKVRRKLPLFGTPKL